MKKIQIEIKEEILKDFIKAMKDFRNESELDGRDITMFGLTIEEYEKHCLTNQNGWEKSKG